ncbi:MAG TPA: histidine phosphatase family protein [Pontiella sp.]
MSKTLYLMRHADANWANGYTSDFDRSLNSHGLRDSSKIGALLKHRNTLPETIVCSSAKRTVQTLQKLDLGVKSITFNQDMYEASTQELLRIIQSLDNGYASAMLIGHNPGISRLITHLTGTQSRALPTCGMATIELKCDSWKAAAECSAELKQFDIPEATN